MSFLTLVVVAHVAISQFHGSVFVHQALVPVSWLCILELFCLVILPLCCCLDFFLIFACLKLMNYVSLFSLCFACLCCECRFSFGAVGLGRDGFGQVGLGRRTG